MLDIEGRIALKQSTCVNINFVSMQVLYTVIIWLQTMPIA